MGGNTKSTAALRRGSTSVSKVATPPATVRNGKGSKPSLTVKLTLPSSILTRFPHEKPPRKAPLPKTAAPSPSTPTPNEKARVVPVKPELNPSPPPPPPQSDVPETPTEKVTLKGSLGPKTGVKRELGEGVEDNAKTKPRPGPKKRQKLDNGPADGNPMGKPTPGAATVPTHKLGPKANQGAINAGLRALDRTGTPCRKWKKSGFSVKTFTGVIWQVPSWRAPKTRQIDPNSDVNEPSLPTSNTQSKENNSSNIGSEKSRSNDLPVAPSSPSPAVLISA